MVSLVKEIEYWNTPLVGAYLLWRFTESYTQNHPTGQAPVSLLHFVASAILTHRSLSERISNRRKDLRSYVKSFEDFKDTDQLLMIHTRALEKRGYTLAAIDLAIHQGLLVWNAEDACLYHRTLDGSPKRGNSLKHDIKLLGDKAETLGKWFSQLEINEIVSFLKVVL